jgi:gas vesicle protein
MATEDQVTKNHRTGSVTSVLTGLLFGGFVGAVTMLLVAPQSGSDTRMIIREKVIELRDRSTEVVENVLDQVRTDKDWLIETGRQKAKEIVHHGQEMAVEQLDRESEEAQVAGKKAMQSN